LIAIIAESMIVMVVYPYLAHSKTIYRGLGAMLASLGWRSVFVLYMFGQYILTGNLAKFLATPADVFGFILISGALSGCLVFGALWVEARTKVVVGKTLKMRPLIATSALLIAVAVTYMV